MDSSASRMVKVDLNSASVEVEITSTETVTKPDTEDLRLSLLDHLRVGRHCFCYSTTSANSKLSFLCMTVINWSIDNVYTR